MNTLEQIDELERIQARQTELFTKRFPELSPRYVPGEGPPRPFAMVIGEAPGAQEDTRLRPFVGPAGVVLRELMTFAQLFTGQTPHFGEGNCWLTNVLKFRPPGNRTPLPAEVKCAQPFLRREWMAIGQPRLIIPVGGTAVKTLFNKNISITRVSGRLNYVDSRLGQRLFIWPMIHPSYGLRSNNDHIRELIERDWENLNQWISDEFGKPEGMFQ